MLPEERRMKIAKLVKEQKNAKVGDLSKKLKVSTMTIRRDLAYLENKGLVVRTHGGAITSDILNQEVPYIKKRESNQGQKSRIGVAGSKLVKEGDSILLDAGTTNLEVAKNLKHMGNITVITNDITIVNELYTCLGIRVLCVGGVVQNNVGAIIGNYAETFIDMINVDLAFIGVSSIDDDYFVSTPTIEKAFLKKKMISCANRSVLLADSSKFNKRSLNKVCNLKDIDILISDQGLDDSDIRQLEMLDIQLLLV